MCIFRIKQSFSYKFVLKCDSKIINLFDQCQHLFFVLLFLAFICWHLIVFNIPKKKKKVLLKPHFWNVIDLYLIIEISDIEKIASECYATEIDIQQFMGKNFKQTERQSFMMLFMNFNYSSFFLIKFFLQTILSGLYIDVTLFYKIQWY